MNTDKRLQEIVSIREWCFEVQKFIYSKMQPPVSMNSSITQASFFSLPKKINSQVLRGFREAKRDMCNWASDLRQNEQIELDKILTEKFGEGLFVNQSKQKSLINKIIKSGTIKDDEQYRLIEETVSVLSQTEPDSEKIKTMNELLIEYCKRSK
jgi:hypothetical protein